MRSIDHFLLCPIRLLNRLNSDSYLVFLQGTLPQIFDDLPVNVGNQMYFTHDGVPPRIALNVMQWLNIQTDGPGEDKRLPLSDQLVYQI